MQYYPNPPQQTYPGATYAPGYFMPMGGQQQIVPIGYGGYNNGGYYSNNYNYFNPYFIKQQQEEQYQTCKQHEYEQINFMKRMYQNACSYQGREATQQELGYYDSLSVYGNNQYTDPRVAQLTPQEYAEYMNIYNNEQAIKANQARVVQLATSTGVKYVDQYQINAMNYIANTYEKERSEIPNDISLIDYLENHAGKKYADAKTREQKRNNTTGKLYNKTEYGNLLDQNKSSLFGGVFDPNASLDDQEVRLPNLISEQTRQERRKRFMETILSQGGI